MVLLAGELDEAERLTVAVKTVRLRINGTDRTGAGAGKER